MAKKFFYDRVYNSRRTITNIIIIGVCVIGIIICFIITSNFQGENKNKPEKVLNIKNEVTVEVNENYSKEIFFSKMDNVNIDEIQVEYEEWFDISEPGTYTVTIIVEDKTYTSTLNVVDTLKPTLVVKDVTINENESYTPKDFVSSCFDNSLKDCAISYGEAFDEDGNVINYGSYKSAGTYTIKILAADNYDNVTTEEAKLYIKRKNNVVPPEEKPKVCKYGNDEYDTEKYLLASKVTSNECAISLDFYKDANKSEQINKLMIAETTRIKKDVDALNLKGTFALNRKITAVINNDGNGIVGYELSMTVTISNDDDIKVVADYKVDSTGNRVFSTNPYNLAN